MSAIKLRREPSKGQAIRFARQAANHTRPNHGERHPLAQDKLEERRAMKFARIDGPTVTEPEPTAAAEPQKTERKQTRRTRQRRK